MLRKFSWVVALFFAATLTANAQSVNLFGGYSYERFRATPSVNTNGYEFSGEYKFMPWLGAMADFDGHYGSFGGVGFGVHDFLFGPQVSFPARISPFAHVLLGGAHFSSNGSGATSFSQGFGFGVDSKIAPALAWRLIQLDYIHTHFGNATQNNVRISTGIVIHF